METLLYFLLGLVLYFLVCRPLIKIEIRQELKLKGNPMNKLKWYEWWT